MFGKPKASPGTKIGRPAKPGQNTKTPVGIPTTGPRKPGTPKSQPPAGK